MSDIRIKTYRDTPKGLVAIFIDKDGNEIDLSQKSCRAKSTDGLVCILDVHHRLINKHLARTEEGQLVTF